MSELAERIGNNPLRYAKNITITVAVLGVIASIIWAIVFASMNWERGIYAGMHGNDARSAVISQLAFDYGGKFVNNMRYAGSAKTHLSAIGAQERVYYFLGPRGVHYCGYEWQSGGGDFTLSTEKGCEFK